jgi:hypothetical protein
MSIARPSSVSIAHTLPPQGTVALTDDQLKKAELMRHRQPRGPASKSSSPDTAFRQT